MQQPYWEHEGTGENHNTLCVASNCYSNCHLTCNVGFTMDRSELGRACLAFGASRAFTKNLEQSRLCHKCGHAAEDHQHYRSKWVEIVKEVTVVDEEAQRRYNDAKSESERISMMQEAMQKEIESLEYDLLKSQDDLFDLGERYNNLALSGSFSGYVTSTIRLLRLRQETMKKDGSPVDSLIKMQDVIDRLLKKQKVLDDAKKAKQTRLSRTIQLVKKQIKKFTPSIK